jgi:hypothetical protein
MKNIQILCLATAFLSLAACQTEPQSGAPDPVNAAAANAASPPTDSNAADAARPATDGANRNEGGPAVAIPAAFHGRWGLVPADCTSTRGDAKGLLTISADTLRFYESRARLDRITASAPTTLTGTFIFEGEGQTWTRTEMLELTGGADMLVRREQAEGQSLSFTYRRCPAA